jgi:hypothetical protein
VHGAPRFGVNYVPSRHWWFSWSDWERDAIAADLAAIAQLGLDHIRVQCLWPLFQPNRGYISDTALRRLAELLDLADELGLDVCVAVLTGWLSGFAFLPVWLAESAAGPARNMFTDPEAIAAEQDLFGAIAETIGTHPRFLGFDLGNELGVLQYRLHPATPAEADRWATLMLAHCERVAPGKLHVNGVDHGHWFADVGFSRAQLATTGSATALHTWAKFTGALDRYGPMGVGSLHLADYCIELARAYHTDLRRPLWVQEAGCSRLWLDEAQIPTFLEQTVRNALTCETLWGFTWWCSHDLSPQLRGFDTLEYDLGLLDAANRPKPAARHLARLIAAWRAEPPAPQTRTVGLVLPDALFAGKPAPVWDAGAAFMALVGEGVHPAIVLASRAEDSAYLAARGIRELLVLPKREQTAPATDGLPGTATSE